ncbi:MAG: 16S rRNA (cytidine(1402)-2'-O)-methyltransferase [Acidobacteriota bacterium]
MAGTLYLVATPIGNLEDITLRALRILKEVALIACEDTRQTNKLLQRYQIDSPTISYHDHNEHARTPQLLARLIAGESIAVVSDAGTPAISDPGFLLVHEAIANQIPIVSIPGPSALLTALTASGLPTDEFLFVGFLPARTGERQRRLNELTTIRATLIFYEAPHRILHTLTDAYKIFGPRPAVIARELTKVHEQFLRGTLDQLLIQLQKEPPRGELVVIIEGATAAQPQTVQQTTSLRDAVAEKMQSENLDKMAALKAVARVLGISKSEAYRRLQIEEKI